MIELLLDAIASLGSTEVQNVLTSVGESAVKKFRESWDFPYEIWNC